MMITNETNKTNEKKGETMETLETMELNKTIITQNPRVLYDQWKNGEIVIAEWQRDFVWDSAKKALFLDSLLLDSIFAPIVFYEIENKEGRPVLEVVDGSQRLRCIFSFLDNEFKAQEPKGQRLYMLKKNTFFKDLEQASKNQLLTASLPTITVKKNSKTLKSELFYRINQGAQPVSRDECIRGSFWGPYVMAINAYEKDPEMSMLIGLKENKNHAFWGSLTRALFYMTKGTRAAPVSFKDLALFVRTQSALNGDEIKEAVNCPLDALKANLKTLGAPGVLYPEGRQVCWPYLALIFCFIMQFKKIDIARNQKAIKDALEKAILDSLEKRRIEGSGAGGRLLADSLRALSVHFSGEQGPRCFPENVKEELWAAGHICGICGGEIASYTDAEVDHIVPYSKGGKTTKDNAQLAHAACNNLKRAG